MDELMEVSDNKKRKSADALAGARADSASQAKPSAPTSSQGGGGGGGGSQGGGGGGGGGGGSAQVTDLTAQLVVKQTREITCLSRGVALLKANTIATIVVPDDNKAIMAMLAAQKKFADAIYKKKGHGLGIEDFASFKGLMVALKSEAVERVDANMKKIAAHWLDSTTLPKDYAGMVLRCSAIPCYHEGKARVELNLDFRMRCYRVDGVDHDVQHEIVTFFAKSNGHVPVGSAPMHANTNDLHDLTDRLRACGVKDSGRKGKGKGRR